MKLLTDNDEPPQAMLHAMGLSDAARHLCPMIAKGDLPLVDGKDTDYKVAEIGNQYVQVLALSIDDATCAVPDTFLTA